MSSLYVIPEFPSTLSYEGDYPTAWSESVDHVRPFTLGDPLSGNLYFHTLDHFGDLPSGGITYPGVDIANATVAPTSGIYPQDLPSSFDELDEHLHPPSLESTPSLTDLSSVPSPFGDAPWGRDVILPTHMTSPAYIQDPIPGRIPATPQPELAWHVEPGRFDETAPSYFVGNASLAGQTAPDYGADYFDITGLETATYLPESLPAQPYGPTHGGTTHVAPGTPPGHMLAAPGTVLGKRSRDIEGTYNDHQAHPNKKGKAKMDMNGTLEATGPSSRARHKSATRIHTDIKRKSKTVGCGAGKLVATTAQEVSHQYLLGPSVQQVLVWPTVPENPTWIEGRAEGGTRHHENSVVRPQAPRRHEEQVDEHIKIPARLKERHRALLAATQADWERAAVDILKCRLCPDADFSDFEDFKRHCETSEAHPSKISFCSHCGDFFARGDALKRHQDKPPKECAKAVAAKADLKRRETVSAHKAFEERLARWLKTGEEIGMPFAHLIKEMFPDSSKKGSKQQSRLPVVRRTKSRAGR